MAWAHLWHCDNRCTELEVPSVVMLLGNCNIQIQILEVGTKVLQEGLKKMECLLKRREKETHRSTCNSLSQHQVASQVLLSNKQSLKSDRL